MNKIPIAISALRSLEVIDATAGELSTWLALLAYCGTVENGGTIPNCKGWGAARWAGICGVHEAYLKVECGLWKWAGNGLVVKFYPKDSEEVFRNKSKQARGAAQARWGKRLTDKDGEK